MDDGREPMKHNAGGEGRVRMHRIDGPQDWEKIARFLWDLLDDIDTLDDACKDDDTSFRKAVYAKQQRRFEVSESDGYAVYFYD